MSKLTDTIEAEWLKEFDSPQGLPTEFFASLEQALLVLIDEAIGPDELVGNGSSQWPWQRNQLRAEIRKKAGL